MSKPKKTALTSSQKSKVLNLVSKGMSTSKAIAQVLNEESEPSKRATI